VPAVAAIQGRLVLFIFIRFKGFLDGFFFIDYIKNIKKKLEFYSRVYIVFIGVAMEFVYNLRTGIV
jgi:hypothetical protein